jgi:Cu/Ag efflux protein CusF
MKKTVLVIVALVVAMLLVNQELSAQANQRTRYFCGRGQVVSIDGDKSGITIAHQAIEGYMSAMTMHFKAADLEVLGYVGAGDRVPVVRLHAVSTCWKVESMEIR